MLAAVNPLLPQLPVTGALPALASALADHGAAVLQAPPGAGKSTLVPLALLEEPFIGEGRILMLEPRRLAARAVAQHMSQILGEPVGTRVGYRTRLETRVSRNTRIEVITEGILTRLLQEDPALEGVACVIFDEFHERSLQADLGLALALESRQTLREGLKILVMSATLDADEVGALLGDAPVIRAGSRNFDVEVRYISRRKDLPLELQMAQVVRAALGEHEGDVLCFLPGAAEIRRVQNNLEAVDPDQSLRVLPLYGELPPAAQDAALAPAPAGSRRVVLATSIAETSLTIEGIRIIVDSGLRRYTQFDPVSGMSRLETGRVSQAAAEQRRGRAGRLSAGVCYRLWSAGEQASLTASTPPEILQADLAPLALELACWGANDPHTLRWMDAPPAAPLAQARDLLHELEALDARGLITAHGRRLARLGAHPRLAHMLVRSQDLGASKLACDLAAILSERDILRASRGARDADIRLRLDVMRGGTRVPPGMSVDAGVLTRVRQTSSRWQRALDGMGDRDIDLDAFAGVVLALAYPDRVGRARGQSGRYLLSNGRGAVLADVQALGRAEYLVAAEVDGAERDARIRLAAPLPANLLLEHFAQHIVERQSIAWDPQEHAVKSMSEQCLGALVLKASPILRPDAQAVMRAVLDGIRAEGIEALPWTPQLHQWRARVRLMRAQGATRDLPEWPNLSDAALLGQLEQWLTPWLEGITRRSQFARIDLDNALQELLTHAQKRALDREAPTHYTVPSGSRIPIDYGDGDTPTLSVRLQEVFGLTRTPAVASGRVPLLLKLLSPAGRPVQVTRDLTSFWDRGYHEVRKDLKGRYPKHYWPDDPHTAVPTRRVRPR